MTLRKFSFLCAVAVFVSVAGCSKKNYNPNNKLNIADNDELSLIEPGTNTAYHVTGALYRAIDPRYIANRSGIIERAGALIIDGEEEVVTSKYFNLMAFDGYSYSEIEHSTVTPGRPWNYYINDKLMYRYSRILVSALKLQSIEKVEYVAVDTITKYLAIMPRSYLMPEEPKHGAVHIYTRDISKGITPDRSTLYLLDDIIITREIFEAINPVFIRSLQRITNREEIAKYGRKNIKEIVKIIPFDGMELDTGVLMPEHIRLFNDPSFVLLVNGIQLPSRRKEIFYKAFINKILSYTNGTKAFISYKDKFPGAYSMEIISIK